MRKSPTLPKLAKFMDHVRRGEIPREPPEDCYLDDRVYGLGMRPFEARDECNAAGMWPIVDAEWTLRLARWLDGRTVLEIMAGCGWIAKALAEHGVRVTATDDGSWAHKGKPVFEVEHLSALDAVREHGARHDVLLCSWPPMTGALTEAIAEWRKPLVYIGESEGGCTADDEFFELFKPEMEGAFGLRSWWGIHDQVFVGAVRALAKVEQSS